MQKRTIITVAAAAVAVTALGVGTGVAVAGSGGQEDSGPDVPITGTDLEKATAVALEHTGEGRITETEVGDEESYYEVEVTLDEGTQVDVQLDQDFSVVGDQADQDDLEDEG
jgi:hypothetical protein